MANHYAHIIERLTNIKLHQEDLVNEMVETYSSCVRGCKQEGYSDTVNEFRDKNISQVAIAVGYQDSNYFDRVFKQQTNMSPKEYQKKFNRTIIPESELS